MIYFARSLKQSREYFLKNPRLKQYTAEILQHPEWTSIGKYHHHKYENREKHLLNVAYLAVNITKLLHGDVETAARVGLLHDFFPYERDKHELPYMEHLNLHPEEALKNAEKYFDLTVEERELILRHMWPFVRVKGKPKHVEGFALVLSDNIAAVMETIYHLAWQKTKRGAKKVGQKTKNGARKVGQKVRRKPRSR
jgi:uncharacterized protein